MGKLSSLVAKVKPGSGDADVYARIDEQMRAAREQGDHEAQRKLLRLRHRAFGELERSTDFSNGSHPEREFELRQGLPVTSPGALDSEAIRAALLTYGCLHIPGLVDEQRVEELKVGIDRVFDSCQRYEEAEEAADDAGPAGDEWYEPFKPGPGYTLGGGRKWNRSGGAIWAADSPRMSFELTDTFDRLGMRDLIGDYLGERPALSMNKSVLRRARPGKGGADWHQDGAFLGPDIRSLNIWLSLSHCGENAPGMDVIPRRLDGIVETGGEGANFDWSVGHGDAERAAGEAGIVRPLFAPGDALLFDHVFLHRTASEPTMTETRYAIESWFFAPSAYPDQQVPLVL